TDTNLTSFRVSPTPSCGVAPPASALPPMWLPRTTRDGVGELGASPDARVHREGGRWTGPEPERRLGVARKKGHLPPRWVIRTFWSLHRRIVRASGGRKGLWAPRPGKWGALRLTTT